MMGEEIRYLTRIRVALDDHNANCPLPALAILLNPTDFANLDIRQLWGFPVEPDERVPTDRFRVDCDGSAWTIEDEISESGILGEEST